MSIDYTVFVSDSWRSELDWDNLDNDGRQRLGKFAYHMYSLGQHLVSTIDKVKYDGRLLVLEDGSRWEVDELDCNDANLWAEMDKIVIIDGEMYNIENAEKVRVVEES